jgi:hypothetical protein
MFRKQRSITDAHAIVANGDDRTLDPLLPKSGDLIDRPQNGYPVDFRASQGGIGIQEPDNTMLRTSLEDIQHDSSVATGTDDDEIHLNIIGREGLCRLK